MTTLRSAGTYACFALSVLLPFVSYADHAMPEGYVPSVHRECSITADLGIGSRSADVECLQRHLIETGLLVLSAPTGYFGELTKTAVVAWQKKNGVPTTGYFGALSRAAFAREKPDEAAHSTAMPSPGHHPSIDVAQWPSVPKVEITVTQDSMSGYNLEIKTENFTFAPQRASSAALPNEGHAHLMVNGKKIARVYGHWFHIPAEAVMAAGTHEIHVTLNANDHSDLTHDGKVIEARYTLTK